MFVQEHQRPRDRHLLGCLYRNRRRDSRVGQLARAHARDRADPKRSQGKEGVDYGHLSSQEDRVALKLGPLAVTRAESRVGWAKAPGTHISPQPVLACGAVPTRWMRAGRDHVGMARMQTIEIEAPPRDCAPLPTLRGRDARW